MPTTREVTAFVRASLPAPPARVLEVGAGAGGLAATLIRLSYDMVAIDPEPRSPAVRGVALHELEEPAGSFDAAVAVISLHHVEPLAESCRRLGDLVRARGHLVIDEFDVRRFDERAARWWLERGGGRSEDEASDPDPLVQDLRGHLHGIDRLRKELDQWFDMAEPVRGPYLYRWDLPPGLRGAEEEMIAAGRLPATGAQMVGTRRG